MLVVLFSKIDKDKIKIKKPIAVGLGNYRLNINYLGNPFFIQTPTLYNPFDISRYDSLDILINSIEDNFGFLEVIKYISSLAEKMANSFDLQYINSIKHNTYSPDRRLRLNISKSCCVFDKDKKKIDISHLKGKTMAKYIISPAYIWMNYVSKTYGIYWEVIQVKVMEKNYDIYMFLDDDEVTSIGGPHIPAPAPPPPPPPPPPILNSFLPDKYNKMIKMGIPRGAIENKMILDGIDPGLYFNKKGKDILNIVRPDPLSLTNAKANLKKAKVEKTKNSISYTGFKPPSLDELNNIRLRLNKISSK